MEFYPLLMEPSCVPQAQTPWGGTMLKDAMLKETAQEILGEEYEFSTREGMQTLVASGSMAGKAIDKIIPEEDGAGNLYVKMMDVSTHLEQTRENTAMFIVLGAEDGAQVVIDGQAYAPRPGDAFLAPAGVKTALKGSIQLLEAGASCQGGADKAGKLSGTTALYRGGSRTYYVCGYGLEACRMNVSGNMPLDLDRYAVITMLGMGKIVWDGGEVEPMPFSTLVLPPHLKGLALCGKFKAMMVSAPDQDSLKAEMGYRAEDIPGLV